MIEVPDPLDPVAEALIKNITDTVRQALKARAITVPPDTPSAQALELVQALVRHIEDNTCLHEDTHRGGTLWEICDACGAQWADDCGGKPEFKWPDVVVRARAFLECSAVAPATPSMKEQLAKARNEALKDVVLLVEKQRLPYTESCDAMSSDWQLMLKSLLRQIRPLMTPES